ncbi:MAG TPA: anhydro-N-acetylmuramic acid kinase [Pseudomonadales bacterium]
MRTRQLYAGLMSGTSVDGIDAVLADFSSAQPLLVASYSHVIPESIKSRIAELCSPASPSSNTNQIDALGELHVQLGRLFADAVLALSAQANVDAKDILAIGSHGQTIRHRPKDSNNPFPFSLQIGDPNTIAHRTGITTVADFRLRDMAAGGQGAPLVPAFHQAVFYSEVMNRIILNIGGIANITLLEKDRSTKVLGFDTGPGNTLMDQWIKQVKGEAYDKSGAWAASGSIHQALLKKLLAHHYFFQPAPKSTGREVFNLPWLESILSELNAINAVDVQRTLLEFTANTITQAIKAQTIKTGEVLVCGGGCHNNLLMTVLAEQLPAFEVSTTTKAGCAPDWVEAMAFAWLAKQTLHQLPGNLPDVTGANTPVVLGGVYFK